jgi:hypothetical protein
MTQKDAKVLYIKYAGQSLEKRNFKLMKTKNIIADYRREKSDRYEEIYTSTLNYQPRVVFQQGACIYIYIIEKILNEINEKFSLKFRITDETKTLYYSGENYLTKQLQLGEVNGKENEQGVIESTKIIIEHIENEVLPAFDLFDDIREIDKRINGEGENWGEQKDFSLGYYEAVRRFIIARLCKSEEDFEEFCNKRYQEIDENLAKINKPKFNRNDKNEWVNLTIIYLKENVEPLY